MIDWVTILIPCPHDDVINDGKQVSISIDGCVEWEVDKYRSIEGSFDSTISIRSFSSPNPIFHTIFKTRYTHLVLSGNPSKFLQGHNVFGNDDIYSLVETAYKRVLSAIDRDSYFSLEHLNNAELTRVDINYSYLLENEIAVNSWLRSAEQSTHLKHRGRGQFKHGTLYFGLKSTYWLIKFYHKGQEIEANKKHQRKDIFDNEKVTAFANKALRCELQLKSRELARKRLKMLRSWKDIDVQKLYNRYISRLEFSNNTMSIIDEKVQNLPAHYQRSYRDWTHGTDIRAFFSKPTFYKHRRYLMDKLGVDIAIKQDSQKPDTTNVVPLVRVLEAVPAPTPDWAKGTDWLFEPERKKEFA